jgi:hypothetical protein
MEELEKLRSMLHDRNLQVVARDAGIKPNLLYRFRLGKPALRYETIQLLIAYFEKQESLND